MTWMIFLRLNSENLAECGTIPPAAFSHRSEAQHTGQSTIHLSTHCGLAGRPFLRSLLDVSLTDSTV